MGFDIGTQPSTTRYMFTWHDAGGNAHHHFLTAVGEPLMKPVKVYGTTITTPGLAGRLDAVVANANLLLDISHAHTHRMIAMRFGYAADWLHLRASQIQERLHWDEFELWRDWFRRQRYAQYNGRAFNPAPCTAELARLNHLQYNGRAPF